MTESTPTVWISASSHRARDKLARQVPNLGPEHGVWPSKGGWPYGSYYEVPAACAEALRRVKGLRVLAGPPRGGRIFKRHTF